MFSEISPLYWYAPESQEEMRLSLFADTHVFNVFAAFNSEMELQNSNIHEVVDRLSKEFLTRIDKSPSDTKILLDPFIMTVNCAYILINRSDSETRDFNSIRLGLKILNLLHSFILISNVRDFILLETERSNTAFAMISHERIGSHGAFAKQMCSEMIQKICKYNTFDEKLPEFEAQQEKQFISMYKREQYVDYLTSNYERHEHRHKIRYSWKMFRAHYTGSVY
jgi:hypothetical protein